jgi:hypothetical protein
VDPQTTIRIQNPFKPEILRSSDYKRRYFARYIFDNGPQEFSRENHDWFAHQKA